jgi:hypothetical protein
MKSINIVLKNINILNLLLLTATIFLFFKLDDSLSLIGQKVNFTIPKPKEVLIKNEEKAAAENSDNYSDYIVIAEKNLFHSQRRIVTEIKEEQQMVKPEIILYGTLITEEKRIAYIEDKKNIYSTPGRGKRQIAIKEGDMIAGYKLAEVNNESILMVRGADKITVTLNTQKERKSGEATAKTTLSGSVSDSTTGQPPSTLQPQVRTTQPSIPMVTPMRVRPTLNSR